MIAIYKIWKKRFVLSTRCACCMHGCFLSPELRSGCVVSCFTVNKLCCHAVCQLRRCRLYFTWSRIQRCHSLRFPLATLSRFPKKNQYLVDIWYPPVMSDSGYRGSHLRLSQAMTLMPATANAIASPPLAMPVSRKAAAAPTCFAISPSDIPNQVLLK